MKKPVSKFAFQVQNLQRYAAVGRIVGGGAGVTNRGLELAVWVIAGLARALSVGAVHVV